MSNVKLESSHANSLEAHAKILCEEDMHLFICGDKPVNHFHKFYKNKFFSSSKLSMNSIWCYVRSQFERN